jgi:hypothetical protein
LIAYFYNGVFDQIKQGSDFEMAVNQSEDVRWFDFAGQFVKRVMIDF